jgi:hypothetical protein
MQRASIPQDRMINLVTTRTYGGFNSSQQQLGPCVAKAPAFIH